MYYIGTAGYSYDDWLGTFYPEETQKKDFLECYSEYFNTVELNFSYYRLPEPKAFYFMMKKSPKMNFVVKAFQGITHKRSSVQSTVEEFKKSLAPLRLREKLLCVLLQFPFSFHYGSDSLDYISKLSDSFGEIPLAMEFRNCEWDREETYALLKEKNIGFVSVDEPLLKGLMPRKAEKTADISYFRFHGRNAQKWWSGEGSERYDYLYSKEELSEWTPKIKELEKKSEKTIISFNNHPRGQAVENALMLKGMLGLEAKKPRLARQQKLF